MYVYEKNNIIYLSNFEKDFEWATNDYPNSAPYFILNDYTRECFKKDILPYIKSNECSIDKNLFNKIKYYVANPRSENFKRIRALPGITYKEHQLKALQWMAIRKKYGFFLGPGSGKTIIAIGFLLSANIKSALIVTPQKVIAQYKQELDKYIPDNNFLVTNYEQLHKYVDHTFEAVILDESHKVKNYSSNANIYCRLIASRATYTYLFTGTPQDKSRHEILAQIAILDQRVMPVKTRTLFRYFNQDDYFNPSTEKKAFSEELTSIIESYTWGKPTEEVVQLMKENDFIINCIKPTMYETLAKDRVIRINIAGKPEPLRCVADNKGVLKVKLRELCNGHLICEELPSKETRVLPINTSKEDKLIELIKTKVPKGIIYYEFDNDIEVITNALKETHTSFKILNGKTNKKDIASIIKDFKNNEFNFLVMQSKSGNAGLDLTNTNNIIFYSLPESYIVYTQCKARINRIGQTQECNYYYLICKDSIEEQMLAALKRKRSFSTRLFKIYN